MSLARALACFNAGSKILIRSEMIEITTNTSINVNARLVDFMPLILMLLCRLIPFCHVIKTIADQYIQYRAVNLTIYLMSFQLLFQNDQNALIMDIISN